MTSTTATPTTTDIHPEQLAPELTRIGSSPSAYSRSLSRLAKKIGYDRLAGNSRRPVETVLDYGTGFGRGLDVLSRTFSEAAIDAYDPLPPSEWAHTQRLLDASDLKTGHYDRIIAAYVLNVLLPDERRRVVLDIARLLAPGGLAVFIVRSWHTDVSKTSTGLPAPERKALYVPHGHFPDGRPRFTYQKGYDFLELMQELDWALAGVRPTCYVSHIDTWGPPLAYIRKESAA